MEVCLPQNTWHTKHNKDPTTSTVEHPAMSPRVSRYVLRRHMLCVFLNWLKKYRDSFPFLPWLRGVPLGSVLGPHAEWFYTPEQMAIGEGVHDNQSLSTEPRSTCVFCSPHKRQPVLYELIIGAKQWTLIWFESSSFGDKGDGRALHNAMVRARERER